MPVQNGPAPAPGTRRAFPLHPEALRWAIARARRDVAKLAKKVGVRPERLEAWCAGEGDGPTPAQARKLARALHIGLSYLLVPPRPVKLPVTDFRRGTRHDSEPSPELLEAVYDALRKRDWMRERRRRPLDFVGSAAGRPPQEVAQHIGKALSIEEIRKQSRNHEEFLKGLARKAEQLGVIVLRQGYVGTDTRRSYDPDEFIGFTIVDEVAPVVFLNTVDYLPRQIFTFVHELAHVWRGEGGLEGGPEEEDASQDAEAWADAVAAEVLMPADRFREHWSGASPVEMAESVSRKLYVSKTAALRRALHLGLLDRAAFFEALEELKRRRPSSQRRGGGGGDFWKTLEIRNSPALIEELRRAAMEDEVDLKDVAVLLNVSIGTALSFIERQPDVSA